MACGYLVKFMQMVYPSDTPPAEGDHVAYDGTNWVPGKAHVMPVYTVATVPDVDPQAQIIYITDLSGGAQLAFSDGTNWRRVSDRTIIS